MFMAKNNLRKEKGTVVQLLKLMNKTSRYENR